MTETDTAFTLVFDGDLREFDRNPMKVESPFGKCVAAHIGDALQKLDDSESEISRLTAALAEAEGRAESALHYLAEWRQEANAATAALAEAEGRNDAIVNKYELICDAWSNALNAANARIAELEGALREIDEVSIDSVAVNIARKALAESSHAPK